jgi:hypothetical protein
MSDDLYLRYQCYDNEVLVTILESEFEEYTVQAKLVAEQLLNERIVLPDAIHFIALQIWKRKITVNFRHYLKENRLPSSKYLTDIELREIFRLQYSELLERKQTIMVDSTKYWFF